MSKQKTQPGLIIMSTFPDQERILKIAKYFIVEKKLCGCISWTKVRSLFFWNNDNALVNLVESGVLTQEWVDSYLKSAQPKGSKSSASTSSTTSPSPPSSLTN